MIVLNFNDAKYIVKNEFSLRTSNGLVPFHESELVNAVRVYPGLLRVGDGKTALYLDTELANKFMENISPVEIVEFEEGVEFKGTDKPVLLESIDSVEDSSVISEKLNVIEIINSKVE